MLDITPEHLQIVRDILQKNIPRREVWAFGSRVKGTAKRYSDLDLAVIGETPLSLLLMLVPVFMQDNFCALPQRI